MKDLITKSPDGSFILTEAGEQELYFITTRKLIQYYLKEVLKKDNDVITQTINSISIYLRDNFKKIDDYLKKIPALANFINENNLEKFQKFMGQYFINTLQKEKTALIKREMDQTGDKLINPFWAPSNELLKIFGPDFKNAPPLNLITRAGKPEEPEVPVKPEKKEPPKTEIPIPGSEPGKTLLRQFTSALTSSPPLNIVLSTSNETSPEEEDEPPSNATPVDEQVTIPDFNPPGMNLLSRFGQSLRKSPPLEMPASNVIREEMKIPAQERLISLKGFATILSNISKFSKTNDSAGYQNWYKDLSPKLKAAVKINSLCNAEKKGSAVNWGQEIMMYAASTNENKDELYQLTEEVKLYLKVLNFIKHRLTVDPNTKLAPAEASNIYIQSVNILSGAESNAQKKSALSILLLQINNASVRDVLFKDFEKILSIIH